MGQEPTVTENKSVVRTPHKSVKVYSNRWASRRAPDGGSRASGPALLESRWRRLRTDPSEAGKPDLYQAPPVRPSQGEARRTQLGTGLRCLPRSSHIGECLGHNIPPLERPKAASESSRLAKSQKGEQKASKYLFLICGKAANGSVLEYSS